MPFRTSTPSMRLGHFSSRPSSDETTSIYSRFNLLYIITSSTISIFELEIYLNYSRAILNIYPFYNSTALKKRNFTN